MRLDFIFSYWILIWYIAYSPKFALIIGILENIGTWFMLIYKKSSITSTLDFALVVFIAKVLPFYFLRNETIQHGDVIFTFVLFGLYNAWLFINNQNFIGVSMQTIDSMAHDKHDTPMLKLFNYIETKVARK
jgi:hypothetical protein